MKENNEDWEKQLNTVIIDMTGFGEIFLQNPVFLQILCKLEGIKYCSDFDFFRKTVFEAISLTQLLKEETIK
jgi:hypothetical protein